TCRPGTRRSASAIERTPERRISEPVSTNTAAAAAPTGSARLDTEVTSTSSSSSKGTLVTSAASLGSATVLSPSSALAATAESVVAQARAIGPVMRQSRAENSVICGLPTDAGPPALYTESSAIPPTRTSCLLSPPHGRARNGAHTVASRGGQVLQCPGYRKP